MKLYIFYCLFFNNNSNTQIKEKIKFIVIIPIIFFVYTLIKNNNKSKNSEEEQKKDIINIKKHEENNSNQETIKINDIKNGKIIIDKNTFPPLPNILKEKYDYLDKLYNIYTDDELSNNFNFILSKIKNIIFILLVDDSKDGIQYVEETCNRLLEVKYNGEFSEFDKMDICNFILRSESHLFKEYPLRSQLFKDLKEEMGPYNDAQQHKIIEFIKYMNIHNELVRNIICVSDSRKETSFNRKKYISLEKHKENFKNLINEIKNQNKIKKNKINNNEEIEYLKEDILKNYNISDNKISNKVFFNTKVGLMLPILFKTWNIYC
jgi:hypothetical protein